MYVTSSFVFGDALGFGNRGAWGYWRRCKTICKEDQRDWPPRIEGRGESCGSGMFECLNPYQIMCAKVARCAVWVTSQNGFGGWFLVRLKPARSGWIDPEQFIFFILLIINVLISITNTIPFQYQLKFLSKRIYEVVCIKYRLLATFNHLTCSPFS